MPMLRALRLFFEGFTLPLKSARLILRSRKLLTLSLLPLLITLGLSAFALSHFQSWATAQGMEWLRAQQWNPDAFWVKAARLVFDLFLVLVGAVTFSIFAGVVASPFNDFLAEAAEDHADPKLPALLPTQLTWRFRIRSIGMDIVKTLFVGVLQLGLLLSSIAVIWIPGLNMVLVTCTFLLLTFQYLTYPQTRRGIGVKESVQFLKNHFALALGLGSVLGLLFSVPFLSAFVMPLAVVSGTLLFGYGHRDR